VGLSHSKRNDDRDGATTSAAKMRAVVGDRRPRFRVRFFRGDVHDPAAIDDLGPHQVGWCCGMLHASGFEVIEQRGGAPHMTAVAKPAEGTATGGVE
jgi:hypothetical protein